MLQIYKVDVYDTGKYRDHLITINSSKLLINWYQDKFIIRFY